MQVPNFTRYSQKNLEKDSFDAIVIGSGISGMTAAAILAKQNKKVLVLEQHYTPGGFTHCFKRKDFEWDVGLHYIGDVHNRSSETFKLFNYISEGRLKWTKTCSPYDQAIFPDQKYDFVDTKEEFLKQMTQYFPDEKKALEAYLQKIKDALKTVGPFFASKVLPRPLSSALYYLTKTSFFKYSDPSVLEVLNSITKNSKLVSVLSTQWGDYGLPPHKASFMIHAMVANHYMKGASFPKGGSSDIFQCIAPTITHKGGKICIKASVENVILDGKRAIGVEMKNGDKIFAPIIISSTGVYNSYKVLLKKGEGTSWYNDLSSKVSKVSPSFAHICLYLGLNKSAEDLDLRSTNQWIFPSYDHQKNYENFMTDPIKNPFPVNYVSFPSTKDSTWKERYPNRSTIEAISLFPYSFFQKWEETAINKRSSPYLKLKQDLSERLLEVILTNNPQIKKDDISHMELSTPLSTQYFSKYAHGEIYGLDHSPNRFRNSHWLKPKTVIKNYYLTGQDISTAGVAGGLYAGLLSASCILKKNILSHI